MSSRIGLVGAGFVGGRHADSLAAQDGVAVVGVADTRSSGRRPWPGGSAPGPTPDGRTCSTARSSTPVRLRPTHLFDVARALVGEVTGGSAVGSRSPGVPGDILDVCTAALRFESGAVGSFSNSCLLPRGTRIGVELVAPGLGLWLTEHRLVVSDRDGERTVDRQVDPIVAEDRAFVAAVRGAGEDIRAPYADALRAHRLATAVAAAAAGAGTVELPATVGARR